MRLWEDSPPIRVFPLLEQQATPEQKVLWHAPQRQVVYTPKEVSLIVYYLGEP